MLKYKVISPINLYSQQDSSRRSKVLKEGYEFLREDTDLDQRVEIWTEAGEYRGVVGWINTKDLFDSCERIGEDIEETEEIEVPQISEGSTEDCELVGDCVNGPEIFVVPKKVCVRFKESVPYDHRGKLIPSWMRYVKLEVSSLGRDGDIVTVSHNGLSFEVDSKFLEEISSEL